MTPSDATLDTLIEAIEAGDLTARTGRRDCGHVAERAGTER